MPKHTTTKTVLARLSSCAELVITALMLLMVVVGGLQVFCRYVLNASLSWSEELQRFAHIWLVFLAIPVAYNRGAHIGMTLFVSKLPPKAQTLLLLLGDMLWLVLAAAMVFCTERILEVAKNQTSPGLGLHMDRVYFVIIVAGAYLAIVALQKVVEHVSQLWLSPESRADTC